MDTRITGSTRRIEVLELVARRAIERLQQDAAMADLVPQLVQAMERLDQAKQARKAASDRRWSARAAADLAEQAAADVVRAVQLHVLEACCGDLKDPGYRKLFPDGLRNMAGKGTVVRDRERKFLAARLAGDPSQADSAKRLGEALTARTQAIDAWEQAVGAERVAVRALGAEAAAFQIACTVARCEATVRLKDPVAVRAFFPSLPAKERAGAGTGEEAGATDAKSEGPPPIPSRNAA